ncbi:uncharacterized protein LOC144616131 [Panthera onca]
MGLSFPRRCGTLEEEQQGEKGCDSSSHLLQLWRWIATVWAVHSDFLPKNMGKEGKGVSLQVEKPGKYYLSLMVIKVSITSGTLHQCILPIPAQEGMCACNSTWGHLKISAN